MFYGDVTKIDDIGLRTLLQSNGTKSHAAIPVFDRDEHLVAVLALDWIFSQIPQEYIKKDYAFNESFKDDFSDGIHSLDKYL